MTAPSSIGGAFPDLTNAQRAIDRAASDSDEALRAAAQQFEALFVQMLLKSVREAGLQGSLPMMAERSGPFQQMYEREMSGEIAKSGQIGIAELIVEQFSRAGVTPGDRGADGGETVQAHSLERGVDYRGRESVNALSAARGYGGSAGQHTPLDFVRELWPVAKAAGEELGINPRAIVAHAALESGWGRSVPKTDAGLSSHNLFGIKADDGWTGAVVARRTLEYEQGTVVSRVARFRAYDSLRTGVQDYVSFLRENPRYTIALTQVSDTETFFEELQHAGYATDPAYSRKLMAVLDGSTLGDSLRSLKLEGQRPINGIAEELGDLGGV